MAETTELADALKGLNERQKASVIEEYNKYAVDYEKNATQQPEGDSAVGAYPGNYDDPTWEAQRDNNFVEAPPQDFTDVTAHELHQNFSENVIWRPGAYGYDIIQVKDTSNPELFFSSAVPFMTVGSIVVCWTAALACQSFTGLFAYSEILFAPKANFEEYQDKGTSTEANSLCLAIGALHLSVGLLSDYWYVTMENQAHKYFWATNYNRSQIVDHFSCVFASIHNGDFVDTLYDLWGMFMFAPVAFDLMGPFNFMALYTSGSIVGITSWIYFQQVGHVMVPQYLATTVGGVNAVIGYLFAVSQTHKVRHSFAITGTAIGSILLQLYKGGIHSSYNIPFMYGAFVGLLGTLIHQSREALQVPYNWISGGKKQESPAVDADEDQDPE